jgi:hypothetical protein
MPSLLVFSSLSVWQAEALPKKQGGGEVEAFSRRQQKEAPSSFAILVPWLRLSWLNKHGIHPGEKKTRHMVAPPPSSPAV